jgi:hypothetical protein
MNNQLDDPEAQFYPPIPLSLRGDENKNIVQCVRIISFHEESQYPPPLSSIWNPNSP